MMKSRLESASPAPMAGLLHNSGIALPKLAPHNPSAWAQFTIRVNGRAKVQAALMTAGIPAAAQYPLPPNRHPAVADPATSLPHANRAAQQVLSLPIHPYIGAEDQALIAEALAGAVCPA
jgi:UDP-2-acetamido-2-deoxy-ribo-hexuluronate aminotransferase